MYVSCLSSSHYNIVISITNTQFAQVRALGETAIFRECGRADADERLPALCFAETYSACNPPTSSLFLPHTHLIILIIDTLLV